MTIAESGMQPTPMTRRGRAIAICLAFAVPSVALGKLAMGVFAIVALLLTLSDFHKAAGWRSLATGLRGPVVAAFAVLLAGWSISSILGVVPARSFEAVFRVAVSVAGCSLLFFRLRGEPGVLPLMLKALTASAVFILGYICFILYVDPAPIAFLELFKRQQIQINVAFKSYMSAAGCLLPFLLWAAFRLRGHWRGLALFAVLMVLAALWNNGVQISRSTMIGILAAGGLVGGWFVLQRVPALLRRAVITGGALLAMALGQMFLSQLPEPPVRAGQEQESEIAVLDWHRQVIWGFVYSRIQMNPFFGVGLNSIDRVEGAKQIIPGMNQEYVPSHPHNWVLEITSETGIVGLLALVAVLAFLFRRLMVMPAGARWTGIALMGAFWGSSLSNFSIWASWWQLCFLLLLVPVFLGAAPDRGGQKQVTDG